MIRQCIAELTCEWEGVEKGTFCRKNLGLKDLAYTMQNNIKHDCSIFFEAFAMHNSWTDKKIPLTIEKVAPVAKVNLVPRKRTGTGCLKVVLETDSRIPETIKN